MPHDLPPWPVVYQQTRRWLAAGCFENLVHDLRVLLRRLAERPTPPTAVILDSRTLQSTPESGARAGYDGAKRRKGSKVHAAVDTLGHLLAAFVTPADAQDRATLERPEPAQSCLSAGSGRVQARRAVLSPQQPPRRALSRGAAIAAFHIPTPSIIHDLASETRRLRVIPTMLRVILRLFRGVSPR